MVIGIFGESCVGKSTLAALLKDKITGQIYTGKDYLRLAKNEANAKDQFIKMLSSASKETENIIYVITEKELLSLLPDTAIRVLVTADLQLIETRFAARMHGNLPEPIKKMLANKHGCFDQETRDLHVVSEVDDLDVICEQIKTIMTH